MLDYRRLKDWPFPVIEQRYTADDSMLYALALGLGEDPVDAAQLAFVDDTEAGQPLALPTMAVVLGFPGSWMQDPATGIDFSKIVHGEEDLVLHRPLPAAGTVRAEHRVNRIVDKGAGRGATIAYDKRVFDAASGELLATVTHTTFARGDGGFAAEQGLGDEPLPPPAPMPDGEADLSLAIRTLPQQALLYRLCADRNPLHSQPDVARAAGFERPILHGLCTYGLAGRAVLALCCGNDPTRLKRLFARFSSPVYPGETVAFELYRDGPGAVRFRARVQARDRVVLDHGRAEFNA
jgi:acyl dehydratase